MSLISTPAVVLQTYRYSETSKVVRLATRDLGVQSAIAKGALRPKSRFGAGLELLSEGVAQLYFRETRELHTLGAFDLVDLRRELAADVGRFAGATALAEVMLKMAPPAPLPSAYETLTGALDALAAAPPDRTDGAGSGVVQRGRRRGPLPPLRSRPAPHAAADRRLPGPPGPERPTRRAARARTVACGSAPPPRRPLRPLPPRRSRPPFGPRLLGASRVGTPPPPPPPFPPPPPHTPPRLFCGPPRPN